MKGLHWRHAAQALGACVTGLTAVLSLSPQVSAEPAPLGFSDQYVFDAPRPESMPSAKAERALLAAYRAAGARAGWDTAGADVTDLRAYGIPNGVAVRVMLGRQTLGENTVLFIQSQEPEVYQRMSQSDLEAYGYKSAFFPPGTLTIATIRHGGDASPLVEIESLRVYTESMTGAVPVAPAESIEGLRAMNVATVERVPTPESICGPDDRVTTNDPFVGRLMPIGCTGWLIQDGVALTAGHCYPGEQMEIIEFGVPRSTPDGRTRPAHPDDQYPVELVTVKKQNAGIGNDWAVFRILPNSNTGELPGEVQGGHYRLSQEARPEHIAVTGYGIDDEAPGAHGGRNEFNQTLQTDDGDEQDPVTYHANGGDGAYFRYRVDTMAANSGSPVIMGEGIAVGIHTHGGCEAGGNHGTAADNDDLRNAIRHFVGNLSNVYID